MGSEQGGFDGESYQARFDRLAGSGFDVHGEADLAWSYLEPLRSHQRTVLDAGCGTGRVGTELARRGALVVGVDVNESMLAVARTRSPELEWVHADLSRLDLGRAFQVVVMAGNVPLFCPADRRDEMVLRCADHLLAGGHLVAGFSLTGDYTLLEWDRACSAAGLVLESRWSTWDRRPWRDDDYAVSVHARQAAEV